MIKKKKEKPDIYEVWQDTRTPLFNSEQGDGIIGVGIRERSVIILSFIMFALFSVLLFKIFILQIVEGKEYRAISTLNSFEESIIFSQRGNIYDRNGELLAWNVESNEREI